MGACSCALRAACPPAFPLVPAAQVACCLGAHANLLSSLHCNMPRPAHTSLLTYDKVVMPHSLVVPRQTRLCSLRCPVSIQIFLTGPIVGCTMYAHHNDCPAMS